MVDQLAFSKKVPPLSTYPKVVMEITVGASKHVP